MTSVDPPSIEQRLGANSGSITKEKRKGGTDTENVTEQTKCLLNTTGIEPLGGELSEVLSRSFIVEFEMDERASDCFLEAKVLARIREQRDLILVMTYVVVVFSIIVQGLTISKLMSRWGVIEDDPPTKQDDAPPNVGEGLAPPAVHDAAGDSPADEPPPS